MSQRRPLLPGLLRRLARFAGSAVWPLPEPFALAGGAFASAECEVLAELPRERVLVLAPHPDDEVIGSGGALARYLDDGSPVSVVYLTDGGGNGENRRELVARRRREAEAVGSLTGVEQIFWSHPDTRLDPLEAAPELARLLERLAPQAVYLPSYFEHHVDHYAANALLARALERVGARPRVLGYEVWDAVPRPNRVLDVTAVLERKLEMMRLYATPLEYTDFEALIRHRAALHYLLHVDSTRRRPPGAAEAFHALPAERFLERFAERDRHLRRGPEASGADPADADDR